MSKPKLIEYIKLISTATALVFQRHQDIVDKRINNPIYEFEVNDNYMEMQSDMIAIWTDLTLVSQSIEGNELDLASLEFIALQLDFTHCVASSYFECFEPTNPEGEQLLTDMFVEINAVIFCAKLITNFQNSW